jgi:hypothetical protein
MIQLSYLNHQYAYIPPKAWILPCIGKVMQVQECELDIIFQKPSLSLTQVLTKDICIIQFFFITMKS